MLEKKIKSRSHGFFLWYIEELTFLIINIAMRRILYGEICVKWICQRSTNVLFHAKNFILQILIKIWVNYLSWIEGGFERHSQYMYCTICCAICWSIMRYLFFIFNSTREFKEQRTCFPSPIPISFYAFYKVL